MSHQEDPLRRGRVIRRRKGAASAPVTDPTERPAASAEPATTAAPASGAPNKAPKAERPAAAGPAGPRRKTPEHSAQPTSRAGRTSFVHRDDTAPKAAEPKTAKAPLRRATSSMDADALMAELQDISAEDFASLLSHGALRRPQPGDRIDGEVVRITHDTLFLDIGAKAEALFDTDEFAEGALPALGDRVSGFVASVGHGGVRLTNKLQGEGAWEALQQSKEDGTDIEGLVESRNQGGYTIRLGDVRAFCPNSQISRLPAKDPDAWVGKTLPFRVTEVRDRDVVVSHRAVQQEAAKEQAAATWADLADGDSRDGIVTGVKEFGAFVDVDGVQGLVPRREFGWGHDVAAPPMGAHVTVRVIGVDREAERLTLSLKDPGSTPWSRVGVDFLEGGTYTGKVTRLTDFGVFVSLAPGLEGLVHVSRLADKHVKHPQDVVAEGDTVQVHLTGLDLERQRLELSMRESDADAAPPMPRHAQKQEKQSLGTFGDLFAGVKLPKR
jgi:small subunit ribosomal protein S1